MSIESKVEAALAVLKQGGLIIVADDESREAEGDMVGLAEFATTETVNRMITSARGLLCLPVAPTIAERLDLDLMTTKSHDAFGTAFTVSLDHHTTTTGISAADRATTIRHVADPTSQPDDFYHPGHMFPLIARAGGVLERRGHTEAAVDLAKMAGVTPAAYICEIVKKNGLMARRKELKALAEGLNIPMITVADIVAYRVRQTQPTLTQLDPVKLPTVHGQFKLTGMQLPSENQLQLALQLGNLNTDEPVLVRLHSECLTGDVFGSQRCDCGQQLQTALQTIGDQGRGLLLYLRQEGRGIGLANKLRAYHLQEQGVDTYDANVQLGLPADARRYDQAAVMLHALGITKIRLMTNNLDKVDQLTAYGIDVVERVPLEIPANEHDAAYLKTKRDKFHHQLSATL
ncbi:GTP cyclohydrolase II [Lactobacillus plantarum JDM1] [Lactiplantibacillus mudanjiangensis]|uniref:GTP cyclohydrolase II n=1 Tax=Lactiplantibacillus mudanjiangensis TaxID=1296538 RepID=UPI0010157F93|nr:GTP cyclohydrolase II [Lactobacillus plantarum JDM1] [Lactiplantibacillus mudanjiangensis]